MNRRSGLALVLVTVLVVLAGILTPGATAADAPSATAAAALPIQPPGLDHFVCYQVPSLGPIAEQVPFGLTPPTATLIDQFGRVAVQPAQTDRLCNPVDKVLPDGTKFSADNPRAHLVGDVINTQTQPPPPKLPIPVRVSNQFGIGKLVVAARQRLCLPTWKQDLQNPTHPGSVPVPVPAGTPPQPPGLDHFECYAVRPLGPTAGQFTKKPPFVSLIDQFGPRTQVPIGNPVELCNPVKKILPTGQSFSPADPVAHLVCFQIQTQPVERVVRTQNQFGTAQLLATQQALLCLPSYKQRLRPPADFNGDGITDVSVFRPSTGVWYASLSGGGSLVTPWGGPGDVPVPGDYNGDGLADIAVFRPSTGVWYASLSGGGSMVTPFGGSGDIATPGDYDGDGTTDVGVFRPSTGLWYASLSGGGSMVTPWGASGDVPAPGDYNGDGTTDVAVFRPSTGAWYASLSGDGSMVTPWGASGDIPEPGDYDGDGTTDVAVFRPSTGGWYASLSGGGSLFMPWGASADKPLPLPSAIRAVFFP